MTDILSDILHTLRLRGSFYFRLGFSPPFGVEVPEYRNSARFHLCVSGQCVIALNAGKSVTLQAGDLVLVPRGKSHCILDEAGRTHPPLEQVLSRVGYRGDGVVIAANCDSKVVSELICGHFTFRDGASHPILAHLPDVIVIDAATRAQFGWLDDLVRMLTRRVFEAGPAAISQGLAAIIQRLAEIMFVEILRVGIAQSEEVKRTVSAFSDERIGKTLALIHTSPERQWTVDLLAREAGMSRARYADLFSSLIGETPVAYLRIWRLQKAAALLEDTRLSIQQVAARVGYLSTAAFSRAFSQQFGSPPTSLRQSRD